jgi:hypothetical protein
MIHFVCECGSQLQASEDQIGSPARCPICGELKTVPDLSRTPVSSSHDSIPPKVSRQRPILADKEFELPRPRSKTRSPMDSLMLVIVCVVLVGIGTLLVLPNHQGQRVPALRTWSANNLRQMALAMNTYALNNNGPFPPVSGGKDGGTSIHPKLSWRVAILPYMEEEKLYADFHLDEPWDSPHNLTLLPRIPKTFQLPQVEAPPGMSYYRAIVGKRTAFEPLALGTEIPVGRRFTDFPKGTGKTIFIVEAADAVPWTEPGELDYAPDLPLPRLMGRCKCVMGDASVMTLDANIPESELRSLMGRTGNP